MVLRIGAFGPHPSGPPRTVSPPPRSRLSLASDSRLGRVVRVGSPLMGFLITAARLFDGTRFIEDGAVWIEGDAIRFAGPASAVPADCSAERKDFGDATISPGLIDLHIHCLGTREYSVNAFLMEDERAAAL